MPTLGFLAIRSFMGAVNRPKPILWITLVAIPMNALLAYLLITTSSPIFYASIGPVCGN